MKKRIILLMLFTFLLCGCNHDNSEDSYINYDVSSHVTEDEKVIKNNLSVHMGSDFSFIVDNGVVYANGDNSFGQLGTSDDTICEYVIPFKNRIIMLEAGADTIFAVDEFNNLYVWGVKFDDFGIDGDNPNCYDFPTKISFDEGIQQISCTGSRVLILSDEGTVYLGSPNENNEIQFEYVSLPDKIVEIAAGGLHFLALTKSGEVFSWGNGSLGQLGTGNTDNIEVPQKLKLDFSVKHISAGESCSYVISDDGIAYSCGTNGYGETGTGSELSNITEFKRMDFPQDVKISKIFPAVFLFASAIDTNGNIYTWGSNVNNSLGLGESAIAKSPIMRNFDVKAVDAAKGGMLFIGIDNNVYAWGNNTNGKLFVDKNITHLSTNTKINKEEYQ